MGAEGISAPYSFYLHFAPGGVERLAKFRTSEVFQQLRNFPEMLLGMLRQHFTRESD
jgi:hypothetical protein